MKAVSVASVAVSFLACGALLAAGDCESRSFSPPVFYRIGPELSTTPPLPHVMLAEDFNGDGKIDFASLNRGNIAIAVLDGNGDGTFGEPRFHALPSGSVPPLYEGMCSGDFNGDGRPDLAAVDFQWTRLVVLLNVGDGSFAKPVQYQIPGQQSPHGVMAIDVDGDSDQDLVLSCDYSGHLSIFKNAGDGSFSLWQSFPSGDRTQFAGGGDFDGDGDPDFVSANAGSLGGGVSDIVVFRNEGGGALREIQRFPVDPAAGPVSVSIADLDNDERLDAVVGSWYDSALFVLWGLGDGRFLDPVVLRTPAWAVQAAIADLDGDGLRDMAVSSFNDPFSPQPPPPVVAVFWNLGSRSFADAESLPCGNQPRYPQAADFDRDGDIDLASVQFGAGNIAVYLNRACHSPLFKRGDPNADGNPNVADAVSVLAYLFARATPPSCLSTADANDDGDVNVADAIYLLAYLFSKKAPPPEPFSSCGADPKPDTLDCAAFAPCGWPR